MTNNADARLATSNIDRAAQIITECVVMMDERLALDIAHRLADAGLLMPDIPDGLNLIGFERKGGGGGLLWDDRITTEALTKGYSAMFAHLTKKENQHD